MTVELKDFKNVSYSRLKKFKESPAELLSYMTKKKDSSSSMDSGSALDCLLFEPEKFEERFYIMPEIVARKKNGEISDSKNTAEYKAAVLDHKSKAKGRIIIDQEEYNEAEKKVAKIKELPQLQRLGFLEGAKFQHKWQLPLKMKHNQLYLRGVLDSIVERDDKVIIWDLKNTSVDTSDTRKLDFHITKMLWDLQAAVYTKWAKSFFKGKKIEYYIFAVEDKLGAFDTLNFNIKKFSDYELENCEIHLMRILKRYDEFVFSYMLDQSQTLRGKEFWHASDYYEN